MKLSEIEVSAPVGRTERGTTITVGDLLRAFAAATGTNMGSQEFDRALSDPAQLHASETISNAMRYRTLEALVTGAKENGPISLQADGLSHVSVESAVETNGKRSIKIKVQIQQSEMQPLGLSEALDRLNEL